MLPELDKDGNLPEGIHLCNIAELIGMFGEGSARRKWLSRYLNEIVDSAIATGRLERLFIWGSFISTKEIPGDLDLLIVMSDDFSLDELTEEFKILFDYVQARVKFNADVFWVKSTIGQDTINTLLDVYQTTRDFKRRGIVEVDLR